MEIKISLSYSIKMYVYVSYFMLLNVLTQLFIQLFVLFEIKHLIAFYLSILNEI